MIADRILISLALLLLSSCNHPANEKEKAIERALKAAKNDPIFGRSMLDWKNPDVVDEGQVFRVRFSPAPGWMGGSVTYSVDKSSGEVKLVFAEQ